MKLSKLIKKLVSVANDFDFNTDDIDVNVEDVKHTIYGFDQKAIVEIEIKVKEQKMKTETRVYGIRNGVLHHSEYTDEQFIHIAEYEGNVWSIKGFQNKFNCDGVYHDTSTNELNRFQDLQIRFINVEVG